MIIRHGVPGDAGVGNIAKELRFRRPVLIFHARQIIGRVPLLRQYHAGIAEVILFEEVILEGVSRRTRYKLLERPPRPPFFMGHELQGIYPAIGNGNAVMYQAAEYPGAFLASHSCTT